MIINKRFLMIVLSITVLLSGCQTIYYPAINAHQEFPKDSGLVMVRVIDAAGAINPTSLTLVRSDGSTSEGPRRIRAARTDHGDSTQYLAYVPPGTYSIESFERRVVRGDYVTIFTFPVGLAEGTFDVEPGEITDLGLMAYYEKPEGDRYEFSVTRIPSDFREGVENYYPSVGLDSLIVNTWNDDGMEYDRLENLARLAGNPIRVIDRVTSSQGDVHLASPFGAIVSITSDGKRQIDGVDSNLSIETIDVSDAGDLVIGLARGGLFLRDTDGEWRDISIDDKFTVGNAEFIEGTEDILVFASSVSEAIIGRIDSSADYELTTLNRFTLATGWDGVKPAQEQKDHRVFGPTPRLFEITSISAADVMGQMRVTVGWNVLRWSSEQDAYRVEGKSLTNVLDRDTFLIDADASYDEDVAFSYETGGRLVAYYRLGFLSEPGYRIWNESDERWTKLPERFRACHLFADTWSDSEMQYCYREANLRTRIMIDVVSRPFFFNESSGMFFAVLKYPKSLSDEDNPQYRLRALSTDNGGESWSITDIEPPSSRCLNTLVFEEYRWVVACTGHSSTIYESRDGGNTWEFMFEQQDF